MDEGRSDSSLTTGSTVVLSSGPTTPTSGRRCRDLVFSRGAFEVESFLAGPSACAWALLRGPLLAEADAGFFSRALGVEDVEAIDDFVFEGLEGRTVFVGLGAERRDFDVGPEVGFEDGAVHFFVQAPELDDSRSSFVGPSRRFRSS